MTSPIWAITWSIWAANRYRWLMILSAIPICAILFGIFSEAIQRSDGLRSLCFLPMVISLILVISIFNFTDRERKNGVAGFPRHLFTLPIRTWVLVSWPMIFAIVSVVGIYLGWAKLVYGPIGFQFLTTWPSFLMAIGVVLYQTIVWSLSGFRFTRLIFLSFGLTFLVAAGLLPYTLESMNNPYLVRNLTLILSGTGLVAYGIALWAVEGQRRGGGRGWNWDRSFIRNLLDRIPRSQRPFSSANSALLWMEWRRSGLMLPLGVLLTLMLIIGPVTWLAGKGPEATARAAFWMTILPFLLAIPVGKGMSKPDFWSLNLQLSPFLATRPITSSQMIAAKLKVAALSTLVTWILLLIVAPLWLWQKGDPRDLNSLWGMFCSIYPPFAQWAIPVLLVLTGMILTWGLMVGSIWTGMSGRSFLYSGSIAVGLPCFLTLLILLNREFDSPGNRSSTLIDLLPWLPWIVASFFTIKIWLAAWFVRKAYQRSLVSIAEVRSYLRIWLAGTSCFITLALVVSPKVEWLRGLLLLGALLVIPLVRISVAPMMVAWNRHR